MLLRRVVQVSCPMASRTYVQQDAAIALSATTRSYPLRLTPPKHDARFTWRTSTSSNTTSSSNSKTRTALASSSALILAPLSPAYLLPAGTLFTSCFTRDEPLNATCTTVIARTEDVALSTKELAESRYLAWWELGLRTVYRACITKGVYGCWDPAVVGPSQSVPIQSLPSQAALDWWHEDRLPLVAPAHGLALADVHTQGLIGITLMEDRTQPLVDSDNFFRTVPGLTPIIHIMATMEGAMDRWLAQRAAHAIAAGSSDGSLISPRTLSISFSAVLPSHRGRGVLGELLIFGIFRQYEASVAEGRPFDLIYTICSNQASARSCQKLSFELVHTQDYEMFESPAGSGNFPFKQKSLAEALTLQMATTEPAISLARHTASTLWVADMKQFRNRWQGKWNQKVVNT